MITTKPKTRLTGFRCRELQKDCYKALRAFMAVNNAACEESLQAIIQYAAWAWQQPGSRQQLVELVQLWKMRRPREEVTIHPIIAD
jgi:hypothetical protein